MKKILFSSIMFLGFAVSATAQTTSNQNAVNSAKQEIKNADVNVSKAAEGAVENATTTVVESKDALIKNFGPKKSKPAPKTEPAKKEESTDKKPK